jgi:hypothetical protein
MYLYVPICTYMYPYVPLWVPICTHMYPICTYMYQYVPHMYLYVPIVPTIFNKFILKKHNICHPLLIINYFHPSPKYNPHTPAHTRTHPHTPAHTRKTGCDVKHFTNTSHYIHAPISNHNHFGQPRLWGNIYSTIK